MTLNDTKVKKLWLLQLQILTAWLKHVLCSPFSYFIYKQGSSQSESTISVWFTSFSYIQYYTTSIILTLHEMYTFVLNNFHQTFSIIAAHYIKKSVSFLMHLCGTEKSHPQCVLYKSSLITNVPWFITQLCRNQVFINPLCATSA